MPVQLFDPKTYLKITDKEKERKMERERDKASKDGGINLKLFCIGRL